VPSIDYLRSQGVTSVLLLRDHVRGTPWERVGDIPVEALGITREDLEAAVLFRLTAPPGSVPTNPTQPGGGTPLPSFPTPGGIGESGFPPQPGASGVPTFPSLPPGSTQPLAPGDVFAQR
jgi:hypothetical protein